MHRLEDKQVCNNMTGVVNRSKRHMNHFLSVDNTRSPANIMNSEYCRPATDLTLLLMASEMYTKKKGWNFLSEFVLKKIVKFEIISNQRAVHLPTKELSSNKK